MLWHKIQGAGGLGGSYWINLLGGTGQEVGRAVALDSAENIIVAGSTTSVGAGLADILVAKYDSSGVLLWARTLGGTSNDYGYGLAIDSADNIIVSSRQESEVVGGADVGLAKYNSSGVLQWQKRLGGISSDYGFALTTDSANNIFLTGMTSSDGAGQGDLLLAKYNSSGVLQWDRTLGGTSNDYGYGVALDSADNIIVCGWTASDGQGSLDLLLAKYNSAGTLQWDKTLGGTVGEVGYGLAIDSSDNIFVAGMTSSVGNGGDDMLLAKYNSSGVLQWQRAIGQAGNDQCFGMALDSAGDIILVGYTQPSGVSARFCITKYSETGANIVWQKYVKQDAGTFVTWGEAVTTNAADDVIAVGYSSTDGVGDNEMLLLKIPSNGEVNGTYGNHTIGDATLSVVSTSLISDNAVLTNATAVLTDATSTLTDAAAVLTEEFFKI